MRFFQKKQIGEALKLVERAQGRKLSPSDINEIAKNMVTQIEENPEIFEAVLQQMYEKGLEIPANLKDEISAQVIQGVAESEKVPNERVVEATEAIVEQLSDKKVAELAKNVDLGIEAKNAIVEAGISDEEKKREEKVNLAIDNLHKLYNKVNDISKDSDIVEKIGEIIQNLPETEVAEQYKIDQLINSIIAKKIMQNYIRFGNTKFDSFSEIQSPEEMFANNMPQLAKCEYKNIPTSVREQYKREYKEEVFRRDLLAQIADRAAKDFAEDGFKKIKIPQSKEMEKISEEEEKYFLETIKQRVKKLNGKIGPLTEMDIKEQIRGNVKTIEAVTEYVTKMGGLPKDTQSAFIQQGQEIMSDENLLAISDYCNKVGLYQALASLGVENAKKLVDAVMHSIEMRQHRIASREDIPKIVGAKFEKNDNPSIIQMDDNKTR